MFILCKTKSFSHENFDLRTRFERKAEGTDLGKRLLSPSASSYFAAVVCVVVGNK